MSASSTSVRECSDCGEPKPLVTFATYRTPKGEIRRRGVCKRCRAAYALENFERLQAWRREYNTRTKSKRHLAQKARRLEAKFFVDVYKESRPCADCGRGFPAVAMDLDHVRGGKIRSISGLVSGAYKLDLIKAEIAKCEVVCAVCHRLRTARRKENTAPQTPSRGARVEESRPPRARLKPARKRGDLVRGSKNRLARLTERDVVEIRRRHVKGARPVDLARAFHVSSFTVYSILARRTWTHVRGGLKASKHRDAYKKAKKSTRPR